MRVTKSYLKSERVQVPAARLKSERVQSTTVVVSGAGHPVTVRIGRSRRRVSSGETPTGFVVKIG